MAKDSKSPSMLDALRAQSEAVRAQGEEARRPVEDALRDIDRRLWAVFRWLDEALGHLSVIQPSVAHQFQLGNVLTIDKPQFDRGFVSYRRRALGGLELMDHVEMFYRLLGPRPITLRVNPGGAAAIEERLRGSTLPYQYQTEQDDKRVVRYGVFQITTMISCSVRFEPDYHTHLLQVSLRNVDRFETVSLEFKPDGLDEVALEDLVRFILGEANTFLRRAPLYGLNRRRSDAPQTPPEEPVYVVEKTARNR
jgi:hypothetical protein